MSTTKYIVNNLTGQTITGDLTINGNVVITGTTNTRPYKVFTALLTQSGGDGQTEKYPGDEIYSGITYYIFTNDDNFDLVQYGAPNSNVGTYFVCNQNATLPLDINIQLNYNTGAPVAIVLENTIGNIWFTYDAIGGYGANSNGLFTIGKTFSSIYSQPVDTVGDGVRFALIQYQYPNVNNIGIQTGRSEFTNLDDYLFNTPIEIRVYN
jgi:hypothetical protein